MQTGFHHLSAPHASLSDLGQGPRPSVKRAQWLPTADKNRPPQASGSIGLKRLAQRDVAVGTHADLTIRTRVWNPSHHRLTSLDQGNMLKCHHDSARG
jgi:hypothetical protein